MPIWLPDGTSISNFASNDVLIDLYITIQSEDVGPSFIKQKFKMAAAAMLSLPEVVMRMRNDVCLYIPNLVKSSVTVREILRCVDIYGSGLRTSHRLSVESCLLCCDLWFVSCSQSRLVVRRSTITRRITASVPSLLSAGGWVGD